jgi:hypothetical protein
VRVLQHFTGYVSEVQLLSCSLVLLATDHPNTYLTVLLSDFPLEDRDRILQGALFDLDIGYLTSPSGQVTREHVFTWR